MTAAVPVAHTSFSVPSPAAATSSSMVIGRSDTRTPQLRSSVSTLSRVTPARMVPASGGVITSSRI